VRRFNVRGGGVLLLGVALLYAGAAAYVQIRLRPEELGPLITSWVQAHTGRTLTLSRAHIDATGTLHIADPVLKSASGRPLLSFAAVSLNLLTGVKLVSPAFTPSEGSATDLADLAEKLTTPSAALPTGPIAVEADWTSPPIHLQGRWDPGLRLLYLDAVQARTERLDVEGERITAGWSPAGPFLWTPHLRVNAHLAQVRLFSGSDKTAQLRITEAGGATFAPTMRITGMPENPQLQVTSGELQATADQALAYLPESMRTAIAPYHPTGKFSTNITGMWSPGKLALSGALTFDGVTLSNLPRIRELKVGPRATVAYADGRLTLGELDLEAAGIALKAAATARIQTGTCTIESMTAHWNHSQLVITGHPTTGSLSGLDLKGTVDLADLPGVGTGVLTADGKLGGTTLDPTLTANVQGSVAISTPSGPLELEHLEGKCAGPMGSLVVSPLSAGLLGGQLTATAHLKGAQLEKLELKLEGVALERVLAHLAQPRTAAGTVGLSFTGTGESLNGNGRLTIPDLQIEIGRSRAEATASRMFRRANVNGGLLTDVFGNDAIKEAGLAHAKETGYYDTLIDEIARPHTLGPLTATVTVARKVRLEIVNGTHLSGYLEVDPRTRAISGKVNRLHLGRVEIRNLTISGTLDAPITHADINQLTMDGKSVVATIRESAMSPGTAAKIGQGLLRKNGTRVQRELERRIGLPEGSGEQIKGDLRDVGDFILDRINRFR
jgi:hypothetical protein